MGKMYTRQSLPSWCSVFGDVTMMRLVSKLMSCQRSDRTSVGTT